MQSGRSEIAVGRAIPVYTPFRICGLRGGISFFESIAANALRLSSLCAGQIDPEIGAISPFGIHIYVTPMGLYDAVT
jgi:hypothetical protein